MVLLSRAAPFFFSKNQRFLLTNFNQLPKLYKPKLITNLKHIIMTPKSSVAKICQFSRPHDNNCFN